MNYLANWVRVSGIIITRIIMLPFEIGMALKDGILGKNECHLTIRDKEGNVTHEL